MIKPQILKTGTMIDNLDRQLIVAVIVYNSAIITYSEDIGGGGSPNS